MRLFPFAMLVASFATAQSTAIINVDTNASKPLNTGFGGFNDEAISPVEYFDYRFNDTAVFLQTGWLRYPGGVSSSAFDWRTGSIDPAWASRFQGTAVSSLLAQGADLVAGKGGASFVEAANRADSVRAKLVVCVNAFTDTPQSAGAMAAFARANNISVAVWELANEPYNFAGIFFSSATDYANKMRPYRDAIKAADPNAVVAIFFSDPGSTTADPNWDQELGSYPDQYWDAVTYHHYTAQSTGDFSQWMADENGALASKTSAYVQSHLAPLNPPGMRFLVSEFDASATNFSLYGAIYVAEYSMRMSTVPSVMYVGSSGFGNGGGISLTNSHQSDVLAAAMGTPIDTLSLDFGFYISAQGFGAGIVNHVLKNAVKWNSTTVTGGDTVPATGLGQIPALYAQAYTDSTGLISLLITNKSAVAQSVAVQLDGAGVGQMQLEYISSPDPSAFNSSSTVMPIMVRNQTASNLATIPPYSVTNMVLSIPLVGAVANSASYQPRLAPQSLAFLSVPLVALSPNLITAPSLPLPTVLNGVSFSIADSAGNSHAVPIVALNVGSANVLIPADVTPGPATLTVFQGTSTVTTAPLTIAPVAPGIFSANENSAGVAAATVQLNTKPLPVDSCDRAWALSCLSVPMSVGTGSDTLYVTLYGTGIAGAKSVQCFAGGQSVPVLYAGPQLQYPGLDQVNITIPHSFAGAGETRIYLIADGVVSNTVSLKFQ